MSGNRGVTLRAQWLGQMLRDLREERGLTLREAGEYLQRTGATISRFETGLYPIRWVDTAALLDLYRVENSSRREVMLQLAGELSHTGWWEKYSQEFSGGIIDYMWLESRAEQIQTFDVTRLNGLVQTPDYAKAWFRAASPTASDEHVARALEVRMKRQDILDGESPASFTSIVDESALYRPVGGHTTMRTQLRHLLDVIERPNIEIRVLPVSVGEHGSPDGAFGLIKMSDPFPVIAYADSPGGSLYIEMQDAEKLATLYDGLYEMALSPEESAAVIESAEQQLQ